MSRSIPLGVVVFVLSCIVRLVEETETHVVVRLLLLLFLLLSLGLLSGRSTTGRTASSGSSATCTT